MIPQDSLSLAVTIIHTTPPHSRDQESDCLSLVMSKLSYKLRKTELHEERAQNFTDCTSEKSWRAAHSLCSPFGEDKNILCEGDSTGAVAMVAILQIIVCRVRALKTWHV